MGSESSLHYKLTQVTLSSYGRECGYVIQIQVDNRPLAIHGVRNEIILHKDLIKDPSKCSVFSKSIYRFTKKRRIIPVLFSLKPLDNLNTNLQGTQKFFE